MGVSRSPRRRRAWVETDERRRLPLACRVALRVGGGRGLKPEQSPDRPRRGRVALRVGGGRGLKRHRRHLLRAARRWGVALRVGGGRGLKPVVCRSLPVPSRVALRVGGGRGLKLALGVEDDGVAGRSPRRRRAWVETPATAPANGAPCVALRVGGGRGLKRSRAASRPARPYCRSPRRRRAWVETGRCRRSVRIWRSLSASAEGVG